MQISCEETWERLLEGKQFVDQNGTYYRAEGDDTSERSTNDKPSKPNHLGSFILSWSRVRMAELYKLINS